MSSIHFERKLQDLEMAMIGFILASEECVKSDLPEDVKEQVFYEMKRFIIICVEETEIITNMMNAAEKTQLLKEELFATANYYWVRRFEREEQ
jgi:hypothetical protein